MECLLDACSFEQRCFLPMHEPRWASKTSGCEHMHFKSVVAQPISVPTVEKQPAAQAGS